MESSPVDSGEEIQGERGGSGSSRRRRRLQPAKRARVPATRIYRAKSRRLKVMMPVRSTILRMMPLTARARSASPTLRSQSAAPRRSPTPVSAAPMQSSEDPLNHEITQLAQPHHHCLIANLPEELFADIVKRINRSSDLNSLSLVSKQLYTLEAGQRSAIRVGCGLSPPTEALASLCSRFPNLRKVDIDYSSWTPDRGNQLDNKGLLVLSSQCPSLTDITLSFCSYINDSGLVYLNRCNKLTSVSLNSAPEITSSGILSVVAGCKNLSTFHLIGCNKVCGPEWLEYLGWHGSLEELVVRDCKGISQYDLLKFGPGWMKLQKFEFEVKGGFWCFRVSFIEGIDPMYDAHNPSRYDFHCQSLKDLRLAAFATGPEIGLRVLLGKCKMLEKLCLEYVHGLNDIDMIAISKSCSNLRSISLWLTPERYDDFRTAFTDKSLKALAFNCPMLQAVELTFTGCEEDYPTEIGFTQNGLLGLIQSCPIRDLVLNGASFFDDEGMKALSSLPFLEKLELVDCKAITDVGMRFIACAPCLSNLTIRLCEYVTDGGVTELVRAQKLEFLVMEGCPRVSLQGVKGAAKSVHYSVESASPGHLKRIDR